MDGLTCVPDGPATDDSHRDHGEGFCVYADIPFAIEVLRKRGRLAAGDRGYFNVLEQNLPKLLETGAFALAFYNAGTDVLGGDRLGHLSLTRDAILKRDRYVIEGLETATVP